MTNRDRQGTAHHEAGHAVVAWALGQPVGPMVVGIGGDETKGKADIESNQDHLSKIDRLAICLAGLEAQDVFECHTNPRTSQSDLVKACEIIGWDAPEGQKRQMLDAGYRRARELILLHRDKLVRLAEHLYRTGTVQPDEVTELMKDAIP